MIKDERKHTIEALLDFTFPQHSIWEFCFWCFEESNQNTGAHIYKHRLLKVDVFFNRVDNWLITKNINNWLHLCTLCWTNPQYCGLLGRSYQISANQLAVTGVFLLSYVKSINCCKDRGSLRNHDRFWVNGFRSFPSFSKVFSDWLLWAHRLALLAPFPAQWLTVSVSSFNIYSI